MLPSDRRSNQGPILPLCGPRLMFSCLLSARLSVHLVQPVQGPCTSCVPRFTDSGPHVAMCILYCTICTSLYHMAQQQEKKQSHKATDHIK